MTDASRNGEGAVPVLAVVGHPNKGKSSIVATLAHDDSVAIARDPGTTTQVREYPMRIDGKLLYVLADTPGFQRPRHVLAWLQAHATDAATRPETVQAFLQTHCDGDQFPDECELLRPIMSNPNAGILYVVDGSRPYGSEYEPEMEILRWTGRPRLAVVNPIGGEAHVDAWRRALDQYFSIVRVFDAMTADFSKQIELLRGLGQLKEGWTACFDGAARALEQDRRERHRLACRAIAEMIEDTVGLVVEMPAGSDASATRRRLESRYLERMRELESHGRAVVERIYDHSRIERREPAFEIVEQDLFAEETWNVFGLTQGQLAVTAALSGAVAGGGVDLALGGASMMLASVLGAGLGAAAAFFGSDRIAEIKVAGVRPLGGKSLTIGPSRNVNLPYVILGRALHHCRLIRQRTHANRAALDVTSAPEQGAWLDALSASERHSLEQIFSILRRGAGDGGSTDSLAQLVRRLMADVDAKVASTGAATADGERR